MAYRTFPPRPDYPTAKSLSDHYPLGGFLHLGLGGKCGMPNALIFFTLIDFLNLSSWR
jgi:hypothetical protein